MAIGYLSAENLKMLPSVRVSASIHFRHLTEITVFRKANKARKAMLAYEKALDWQELFDLAIQQHIESDELVSFAYRTAGVYHVHSIELLPNNMNI